jgi:hypothetical protein
MCACAGSSTDRTTGLSPASPRNRPDRRKSIFKHIAGQVRMDLELGRIGFMSTQRQEDRWQRSSCTDRARASGRSRPSLAARNGRADATVGTAPPDIPVSFHLSDEYLSPGIPERFHPSDESLSPGAPERLATNSLQLDYRTASVVRLVPFNIRQSMRSSPPALGAERAAPGRPVMHGSSLRHTPIPPGFASLHPPLP